VATTSDLLLPVIVPLSRPRIVGVSFGLGWVPLTVLGMKVMANGVYL